MHFDPTISLGNVITIICFVASIVGARLSLYGKMDQRLAKLEGILMDNAATLIAHSGRMEKHDDLLLRLVGDMQRLIGRFETRLPPDRLR